MTSETSSKSVVTCRSQDGLALLQIDDGKANTIQPAWCDEMMQCMDRVEREDVSALIISGRPGFLSAGLDLGVFPKLRGRELTHAMNLFVSTMKRLFLFPKPVIVASTGHAIAGGMMLLLAADYRLALEDDRSRYGLNEAITGVPLLGGTIGICQHAIPPQHHTEMILHGRILSARQCRDRGVIHELARDTGELMDRALARAEQLRDLHLKTYEINKLILRRPIFDEAVRVSESLMSETSSENIFANLKT